MHHNYTDITSRIAEPPAWWDEHAVPRYGDFSPDQVADIYADEVALVLIACQACGRRFPVAFSSTCAMSHLNKYHWNQAELATATEINQHPLADAIKDNAIHFGDPPNVECCPAGATMNCDDLKVLQYWRREHMKWVRDSSFEIMLDPELR